MLTEPERTAYDLRIRLLGFPIRVHPLFWVGAALLGANSLDYGLHFLAAWIAIVFVSILVHELGHAVAFRRFGSDSSIVMYIFGGLAIPWSHISGRGRRILIYLAGPFAGFILCGLVYGSNQLFDWGSRTNGPFQYMIYQWLIFVNLYWGILNLLPIFPLDGGQVSREVCGKFWGGRGQRISLQVSFVAALVLVGYSLLCVLDRQDIGAGLIAELPYWFPRGTLWTALLFALLAMSSYQLLQQSAWSEDHWNDRRPWQ